MKTKNTKTKHLFKVVLATFILSSFYACDKEETNENEDESLYSEIAAGSGFTYYKNSDTIQESSPESAHTDYFRVRFNATAYAALTDNGKLPENGTFPDGSIVAKELYNTPNGALIVTAVMKKSTSDNAANGWLWAEYGPDGEVKYSTDEKGAGCISCHSVNDRDNVRLFELFP